ncbi:unnamed protein product [Calypogeia fissa]
MEEEGVLMKRDCEGERYQLVPCPEESLLYSMAIRLAPDVLEKIKRAEDSEEMTAMKFGSNTYGNIIKIADEQFQFSSGPEPREVCKIFEEQRKGEDGNGLLVQVGELRGTLSMARTLNANEEAAMKTRMAEAKKRQRSCKEFVMNHTNSMILRAVPKKDSSQKKRKMAPVVKTEISTKELQRFLITLLVDKPTGLSMKAVQKALEEAMPDTMPDHKRIRRMVEPVASYPAPGKYVLKDGVQKEFYAKPSSDSGSSRAVPVPKENSPEIADAHYIRIGRYESLMEGSLAKDARGNGTGKEESIVEDGEIVMVDKNVSICSATEDNNVEDGEIVMGDNNSSINSSSTEAENDVEDGEIVNGDNNVSITLEENHVEDGEIATGYNNVSIINATEHNNVEDGEIFIGDNVTISRATEDSNVEDGEIVLGDNNVSISRATEDSNVEDGEIVMGDTTDSISSATEVDNNVEDTEIVDIGDSNCGEEKRSWTRQSGHIEGPEFFAPYEKRAAELKSSPILQYKQYLCSLKEYSEKYQVYVRLNNILNGTKAHFESLSREITVARATQDKSKLEQVYAKVWRDHIHSSKRFKRMKRTFFVLHDELKVIKQHCKEYAKKVNKGDGLAPKRQCLV